MWLEKVNAAGGINVGGTKMKVQLVEYDYQSDGQRAAQLAEKLITDDKVDFLLSPFGSGHTKIVATIAERYEMPVIACAASSESVFDQTLKHLFGTLSPNAGMFGPMIKYFKEKMPRSSVWRCSAATTCSRSRRRKAFPPPPRPPASTWSTTSSTPSAPWTIRRRCRRSRPAIPTGSTSPATPRT